MEAAICGVTEISAQEYRQRYNNLSNIDAKTNKDGFNREFTVSVRIVLRSIYHCNTVLSFMVPFMVGPDYFASFPTMSGISACISFAPLKGACFVFLTARRYQFSGFYVCSPSRNKVEPIIQ